MSELMNVPKEIPVNSTNPPFEQEIYRAFLNALLELLKSPIQNLERWSLLTLVLVAVSVMTVVFGGIFAVLEGGPTVQLVSSVSGILTSVIGGLVITQFRSARTEVMGSRDLLLDELSKLGGRIFGDREPEAFYYVSKTNIVGRFIRAGDREWNDEAVSTQENYLFRFSFQRLEGRRIILKDHSRGIEVEIDQEQKKIWWTKEGLREFLYDVICTEYRWAGSSQKLRP